MEDKPARPPLYGQRDLFKELVEDFRKTCEAGGSKDDFEELAAMGLGIMSQVGISEQDALEQAGLSIGASGAIIHRWITDPSKTHYETLCNVLEGMLSVLASSIGDLETALELIAEVTTKKAQKDGMPRFRIVVEQLCKKLSEYGSDEHLALVADIMTEVQNQAAEGYEKEFRNRIIRRLKQAFTDMLGKKPAGEEATTDPPTDTLLN